MKQKQNPLEIIADELETLHGFAAAVQAHMSAANQAQAEANDMLGRILSQLSDYAKDNEQTARRVTRLERRIPPKPTVDHKHS